METTTYSNITRKQARVIDGIIDYTTLHGHYEVKELNVEEFYGDVSVRLTVGMPNDEGTMAEYICRDSYLFWVGKKGGVYQYKEKKDGSDYYKVYCKHGIVERSKY